MCPALPLDEAISKALLAAIARHGGTRAYPARAVLINEGDDSDSLFIVLEGRVKVYATSAEGREVVLGELGPGEYFGELSIDGGPRSVSVMTLGPCTCCVVPGAQLRQFLAAYPDFALHLAVKLCRLVRRLTEQVKGLALHNVQGRIVRLLADLSEFFTAFSGMIDGFRDRAHRVNRLLTDRQTCFIVVCGFIAVSRSSTPTAPSAMLVRLSQMPSNNQ